MWQIDNLRRALQEAQDRDSKTTSSDSASSNGASLSPGNDSTSADAATSGSPSDNGASYSGGNGSHASSFPAAAGPYDDADQSRVPVSSNGAGPYSDGLMDGQQAEADRGGNVSTVTGRGSWQTQGLFRDENSDEEKGPGPIGEGNGYAAASPGATRSQNGAEPAESASVSSSSSPTATATPTPNPPAALQSPSPSAASTQLSPSPAADGRMENGRSSKPAKERRQGSGIQQRQSAASQQLAWDSADQEFDDAATVMNVLRYAAPSATHHQSLCMDRARAASAEKHRWISNTLIKHCHHGCKAFIVSVRIFLHGGPWNHQQGSAVQETSHFFTQTFTQFMYASSPRLWRL